MNSLILSGGVGSRLWPVSREKLPKQFSPLFEKSLFVQTAERLSPFGKVYVCTSENLRGLTEMAIRKESLSIAQPFYEPVGRNTAPAIALVCKVLMDEGQGDEVLGVFPSDHWIENEKAFSQALKLAEVCAEAEQIVTIGIKPDRAATGFGYVECQTDVFKTQGDLKAFKVEGFKEKPDQQTAQKYVDSGQFFWNSGMFVFKVSTMVEAFKSFMPELWQGLAKLDGDLGNIKSVYPELPAQSIDYGIMEKAKNQVNIPCDIGWSDLGSWDDMAEIAAEKSLKSSVDLHTQNAKNCFAHSDRKKTICVSGVDDLIIVDTDDALLVTQKNKSQSVKDIYQELKEKKNDLVSQHQFEYRPWGLYRNLYEEEGFKTKVITVDAGQQLSYQSHTKRSEIWVVVAGKGEVVLNDEVIAVAPGKIVTVPKNAKHRMRNTGPEALKFVEVQLGDYFGEEDITRYEDDYKRM